jgi:tetratricopeptide (TPR) repeat protein
MAVQMVCGSVRTRMAFIVLMLAVLAGLLGDTAPASAQGGSAAALTQARKLVAVTKARLGERDPQYLAALEKLSLAYAALGRDERAVAVAEQAIDIIRSRNKAIGSDLADMLVRLANRYDSTGRQHAATNFYGNALRIRLELQKRQPRANELKIASTATELAVAVADGGDLAQAVELHAFALAIRERRLGANDLLVAENLHGLAGLAAKQDRRDEAERLFRRVLAIREDKLGPTHGDVAYVLDELADVLAGDRHTEAEALRARAEVIRQTDRPVFLRGPLMRPGPRFAPPPALAPGRAPHGVVPRPS